LNNLLNKNILDSWIIKEGEKCNGQYQYRDNLPLSVDMPASVILEVTYAEPGIKETQLLTLQSLQQ
jgi:elongation factor P